MKNFLFLALLAAVTHQIPYECRENHYRTLNLTEHATIQEIKQTFKQLSKIYHPDKNKNIYDQEYYKDVVVAHQVLGKEKTKLDYDIRCRKIKVPKTVHSSQNEDKNVSNQQTQINQYEEVGTGEITFLERFLKSGVGKGFIFCVFMGLLFNIINFMMFAGFQK